MIGQSTLTCCELSGSGDYKTIESDLSLFVGRFDFEREVRPFMCSYREWDLYVMDSKGMKPSHELQNLEDLAKLIRSYPNRLFVIWNDHTWGRLLSVAPDVCGQTNCIPCDCPDWCNLIVKAIKREQRRAKTRPRTDKKDV